MSLSSVDLDLVPHWLDLTPWCSTSGGSCSGDCCATSGESDSAALDATGTEHWCVAGEKLVCVLVVIHCRAPAGSASACKPHALILLPVVLLLADCVIGCSLPQHIWHDEESNMGPSDVDLVQVGDTSVASSDGDVLELHVHVVLSLEELAAVDLAGSDLEGDDVALLKGQYMSNVSYGWPMRGYIIWRGKEERDKPAPRSRA